MRWRNVGIKIQFYPFNWGLCAWTGKDPGAYLPMAGLELGPFSFTVHW